MNIPEDKKMHLLFGTAAAVGAVAVLLIGKYVGSGAAVAFAATAVGVGYELVQKLRNSGEPSAADAVYTAAPGWAVWAVDLLWEVKPWN